MMRTEDIPAMSGYAFEPAAIKGNALETLRWLQRTCTAESSTYILHRNSHGGDLKVFDLEGINAALQSSAASSTAATTTSRCEEWMGQATSHTVDLPCAAASVGLCLSCVTRRHLLAAEDPINSGPLAPKVQAVYGRGQ